MSGISRLSNKMNKTNNNVNRFYQREKMEIILLEVNGPHALALAEQLRHDTELKKNEQLRQYAFDIPSVDHRENKCHYIC